jgi:hypothetical protein
VLSQTDGSIRETLRHHHRPGVLLPLAYRAKIRSPLNMAADRALNAETDGDPAVPD